MLSAENGRFPSNRCVACTMNALFTILANPKFSNDLQAFDNPDQVLLPRRFRPFTQPRERRSVSIVADRDQRLQSGNCLVFQALNEALVRPLSGASTCGQANFFQSDRRWKQNASLAQVIDHHGDNSVAPIISVNLLCNEAKHVERRIFIDANHSSWKTEVGEMHSKTEPVGVPPALTD